MQATTCSGKLFMGLDCSTQSLKSSIVDSSLRVVHECSVSFDQDLPQFNTQGGVHRSSDGMTVTAPPTMWMAALDLVFWKMKESGLPFDQITSISGSGQQHGSVFWKRGASQVLHRLNTQQGAIDESSSKGLVELLEAPEGLFSVEDSPIWMDSSTTRQCRRLEDALGGPQKVAELTGSRAYERFTGYAISMNEPLQISISCNLIRSVNSSATGTRLPS